MTVCTYGTARTITTVRNLTNTSPLTYLTSAGGSCGGNSSPSPSAVVAVCLDIEATASGGQATGYESLAYVLSPTYSQTVG
jgi:hypothetical protein